MAHVLYLTPSKLAVRVNEAGEVGVIMELPRHEFALPEGLDAIQMSPAEARELCRVLLEKAGEAESQSKLPRH